MKTTLIDMAKKIRLVISDVDGVLTTGALFYGPNGTEIKDFNVHDGLGMRLLQESGVPIAIITARTSEAVTKRMQDLEITHVYQGQKNKLAAYEDLKKKMNLSDGEIAYIGDDLPDLPLLIRAGLSISVANAPKVVQENVALVTRAGGGEGAMRELCDIIMKAQGTYHSILDTYLQR